MAQAPDRKTTTACHLFSWGQLNLFKSLFLSFLALPTFMMSQTHPSPSPCGGHIRHSAKMSALLLSKVFGFVSFGNSSEMLSWFLLCVSDFKPIKCFDTQVNR